MSPSLDPGRLAGPLLVLVAVAALAPDAAAAPRLAYVDEVSVFGGPEPSVGRAFIDQVLREAGLSPTFAPASREPCGEARTCLAKRAREVGAEIAVRLTLAEVAGEVSASLFVVGARGSPWRYRKESVDLGAGDAEVAAALASSPLLSRRGEEMQASRKAAWSLAGTGLVLAAGGALALWRAYDLRSEFFDRHVDSGGNVVGISPGDARAAETRAQRWSLAGGLLLGAGAAAGVSASVLFVQGRGERTARPAGLALAGEF